MWGIAIYDKQEGKLMLSRDRLGVKPLYYHITKDKLIFSSELKGILAHEK
jgi:asparagine synthase (glutamine-hydrolysing)